MAFLPRWEISGSMKRVSYAVVNSICSYLLDFPPATRTIAGLHPDIYADILSLFVFCVFTARRFVRLFSRPTMIRPRKFSIANRVGGKNKVRPGYENFTLTRANSRRNYRLKILSRSN